MLTKTETRAKLQTNHSQQRSVAKARELPHQLSEADACSGGKEDGQYDGVRQKSVRREHAVDHRGRSQHPAARPRSSRGTPVLPKQIDPTLEMVGLALLTGLRRGELFAWRWKDQDEQEQSLAVREAVYDGVFDTPKTEAGIRES